MLFPLESVSAWDSTNPVYFGCGLAKKAARKMKELGCKNVLIVTDQGVKGAGILEPIIAGFDDERLDYVLFDSVLSDPTDRQTEEVACFGKAHGIDSVLAVGGGSVMDTGKAAALLQVYPAPINDYFPGPGQHTFDQRLVPSIVVIPTTAGTGSEVSPGAVITDSATHAKLPVDIGVTLAIVDPEVTVGMPVSITVSTAIDAFAHAAEAVISAIPNIFSETLGLEAVRLISEDLPKLVREPKNLALREHISKAAVFGGLALRGALGNLPHTFGGGITRLFGKPHGVTVGLFLPTNFKLQATVAPEKVKLIVEAMGYEVPDNATPEQIGQLAFEAIRGLLVEVGFPNFRSICEDKKFVLDNIGAFWTEADIGSPILFSKYAINSRDQALAFVADAYDAF